MNLLLGIGSFIKSHIVASIVVGTVVVGGTTTVVLVANDVIELPPAVESIFGGNDKTDKDKSNGDQKQRKEDCSYSDKKETEEDCIKLAENHTRQFYLDHGCTEEELASVDNILKFAVSDAYDRCNKRLYEEQKVKEPAECHKDMINKGYYKYSSTPNSTGGIYCLIGDAPVDAITELPPEGMRPNQGESCRAECSFHYAD